MTTVTALFKDLDTARSAAAQLAVIGIADSDISIISNQSGHLTALADPVESTVTGAGIGAIGGGAIGLVAGIAMTPVAGMGLVGVIGWLASALGGASAGLVTGATVAGVVDILRSSGTSDVEAHFFTEGLRAGGALVAVRSGHSGEAAEILRKMGGASALPPVSQASE
jgi:hypothetical protein